MSLHHPELAKALIGNIQRTGGWISFAHFMQMVLYHPQWGYYTRTGGHFGHSGDFITAPEMGKLFAHSLATQLSHAFKQGVRPVVLEFGAGSGRLAAQLICILEEMGTPLLHYYVLEVSGSLIHHQKQTISQAFPFKQSLPISWISRLPTQFCGVVIANEVLDAMPVELMQWEQQSVLQGGVMIEQDQAFYLKFQDCQDAALKQQAQCIQKRYDFPTDVIYQSELSTYIPAWLSSLFDACDQAAVILIDYGFPGGVFYHPSRNQGTLMCHHQHRSNSDPLRSIGYQDITAHVDFSAVAEIALQVGFEWDGLYTQAAFLLHNGVLSYLEHVQRTAALQDYLAQAHQAQVLLSPAEMGEIFKLAFFSKNISSDWLDTTSYDLSERL